MTKRKTEQQYLDAFAKIVRAKDAGTHGIVLGVGDDTAVLRPPAGNDVLLTNDAQVEGRHFRREWFAGLEVGWRLAAVNLSDIAAMGGRPLYGVLSFILPDRIDADYVSDVERGVRDHLAQYKASIVGGNVSGGDGSLVCDLTLIGAVKKAKAWSRRATPRDVIVVAGVLGESVAGLGALRSGSDSHKRLIRAYKKPKPLLDVAKLLGGDKTVGGAIDVSDGFSTDLLRMCRASGVGAEVEIRALPVSKPLFRYCQESGRVPLECVLHGGEDYALILAVRAREAEAVVETIKRKLKIPATIVGRFTAGAGRYDLLGSRGRRSKLVARGWDHFA